MISNIGVLEHEISALEKKLVELKRRRNSYIRICRLPPEILVQVFGWFQHRRCIPNHAQPWKTYDRKWPRIMAVCKHFRDVALHAPTLWTVIDFETHSPQWRELCMARSGDAALVLHAHSTSRPDWFYRARSARVSAFGEIASVLNAPAPRLRILKVRAYLEEDEEDEVVAFAFTARFLGGQAANLVSLILRGCRISIYDAPPMPAVRRLELDIATFHAGMDSLWLLLSATPAVEDLSVFGISLAEVDWRLPKFEDVVPIPAVSVTLPSLTHFMINDFPAEVSALLRMISTPGSLHATVKSPLDGVESDEDDRRPGAPKLNENHIIIFDRWIATIPPHALSKVKGSASLNVPYSKRGVTIRFTCEDVPDSTMVMTCDIDDAVQNRILDRVEVLRLVYQRASLDDGQSRDVFNAPNIRNLHNLRGLELMHFNFTTEERTSLKTCLRDRQGRIKYVNLIDCDTTGTRELSYALKSEELIPELSLTVIPHTY